MRTHTIRPSRVQNLVSAIFDDDLHAKRVASLGNAVVGALVGVRLAVATLGRALAIAKNRNPKHAIEQVDRFFSNTGVGVWNSSPPGFRSRRLGVADPRTGGDTAVQRVRRRTELPYPRPGRGVRPGT